MFDKLPQRLSEDDETSMARVFPSRQVESRTAASRREFLTSAAVAAGSLVVCRSAAAEPAEPLEHTQLRDKGDRWNESRLTSDPLTGRPVRQLTAVGFYNEKPTYHTNTSFTADGKFCIFATARSGQSTLCRCEPATGEIVQLTQPAPGIGSWGTQKLIDRPMQPEESGPWTRGNGIRALTACVAPRGRFAAYFTDRSLRTVHLDTLEERVLVPDIGRDWIEGSIHISPAETELLVPLIPAHPDLASGRRPIRTYVGAMTPDKMRTRYLRVSLPDGSASTPWIDEGVGNAHCQYCPTDPDLVLIDRDRPPKYWCGGDFGKTNRSWLRRLSTGTLIPIIPRNAQRFQVHCTWTWDGQHVLYHGWCAKGGWYLGVADREGRVVQEYEFPKANGYGHVSAAVGRPAMILDGNVSTDRLQWLYYDASEPRLVPIIRHGTAWTGFMNRLHMADPHPQNDPTGRWILFQSATDRRSDLFVVAVEGTADKAQNP